MTHIQLCIIFGYPCSMPRYAKKRTYRRKRSYSTKKRYTGKPVSRKYRVKSYRRKKALPANPFKANAYLMRRQYAHYLSHVDSLVKVPSGVLMTGTNGIQAIQYRYYRLDTYNTLDVAINKFTNLYQYYRMKHVWIELKPKWNMTPSAVGIQMGEVVIVPLKRPEEIYRCGQQNVAFGGTFAAPTVLNYEQWLLVPGAKKFSFTKPGSVARMKVPLYTFTDDLENPNIGTPASLTAEIHSHKAQWHPVMSTGAISPILSSLRHYGFAVMFYGWDTSLVSAEFNFEMRQFLELEFKTLNVYPATGFGLSDQPPEMQDEPLHVEEPWEEEDSKSQSSHAEPALKRAFTNMNLTPTTVSTMPSPQATAGARPNQVTRA